MAIIESGPSRGGSVMERMLEPQESGMYREAYCEECGKAIEWNETVYDVDGWICGDCFLKWVEENILASEIAAGLGYCAKSGEALATEQMFDEGYGG